MSVAVTVKRQRSPSSKKPKRTRRMGRPRLAEEKSALIGVHCTQSFHAAFNRAALALGMTASDAARDAIILWLRSVEAELDEP